LDLCSIPSLLRLILVIFILILHRQENHMKGLGIYERIITKYGFKIGRKGMDWIHLAQI
jgi:hypothetical protein